jgi:pimeloyl-ACP methyl ester carboxylesterase
MVEQQRLTLWQGRVETEVEISGSGTPLVWFHGPWGLPPDREFLARQAERYTVYAPKHPGTSSGAPNAAQALDNFWDLVVYYGEVLDRLGLEKPVLAGHSFGGMVAAELAATNPSRCRKLVLLDPVGLWRDDMPVRNWMILPDNARAATLFANPEGPAARRFFAVPEDPKGRVASIVAFVWAQATTGKFVWPIPDRGLHKHLHRIAAPTLILWGRDDRIINPNYADIFADGIAHARVALIDQAGHLPHLEQTEAVTGLIDDFLT